MTESQEAVLSMDRGATRKLAKLDRNIYARFVEFQKKFCANMNQPGLRLKRLQGDRRLWSARVTDDYRAILYEITGAQFMLLDVVPRQSAYDGIESRYGAAVNAVTGAFEITDFEELRAAVRGMDKAEPAAPQAFTTHSDPVADDRFKDQPDEVLINLGVPAPLLPLIREISTLDQLMSFCEWAPHHTAEVLQALDEGFSAKEVEEIVTDPVRPAEPVDTTDLETAVQRPASYVTSSDAAVAAMLDGRFQEWRLWPHPTQKQIIQRTYNGPARIGGGPGTGKTVVALHRAARLAKRLDPDGDDRVLLTTFTRNLAVDLKSKLALLVDEKTMGRIDVEHLDSVVYRLAAEQSGGLGSAVGDNNLIGWWRLICQEQGETEFTPEFLLDEWTEVICAQLLTRRSDYLQARRVKRPRRLNRLQRARVWELSERFSARLVEKQAWCWPQMRATTALTERHRSERGYRYRHIVVDEAQDLTSAHWVLLRALAPQRSDDLFIAGDTFQRIYGQPVTLGQLGIEIRGRSKRLTLNYRTTKEILKTALAIEAGAEADNLDGEADSLAGYRSVMSGATPEFRPQADEDAELAAIAAQARAWTDAHGPGGIAVAVPQKRLIGKVLGALDAVGIDGFQLGSDQEPEAETVHVGTMHRLKGLEYRFMLISCIGAEYFPYDFVRELAETDPHRHELEMVKARNLLFVAVTRARDEVVFTWAGEPSPLLRLERAA
ncbi:ATP-dependent helicase [Glycomyces endophyticus]|uniref:DNA 3'-5' helicase n=1 Tax=Glycomyces endophyticus TaxID=480996 RepID=A0ABN2HPP6_9ACTN